MPKKINEILIRDVATLKRLQFMKDEIAYKQLFESVMQRHSISRPSLNYELSKDFPRDVKRYDSRGRTVPIGLQEAEMVKEMHSKAKTGKQIQEVMSLELGFSYTYRRLQKVKQLIKEGSLLESIRSIGCYNDPQYNNSEAVNGEKVNSEAANGQKVNGQMVNGESGNGKSVNVNKEHAEFKGNLRRLFYRLARLAKMDPLEPVSLVVAGISYKVHPRVIKSCLDHIAASASNNGADTDDIIRFNIQTILLNESNDYKRGFYISPGGLKQLEVTRKSLAAVSKGKKGSGGYTLNDLYSTVSYFSPGVSKAKVINYLKINDMGLIDKEKD